MRGWHGDHSLKLVISPPDGIRWPSPVPPGQSILIAYKPELVRRPPKAFQFALPPGVKSRMVLEVKVQEASILWTVPPGLQRGQMVKIKTAWWLGGEHYRYRRWRSEGHRERELERGYKGLCARVCYRDKGKGSVG